MTDVIIFTRANGGVTRRNLPAGATAEDFDREIARAVETGKAVDQPVIADSASMPYYGSFRNAWVRQGDALVVDMPKARNIKTSQARVLRDERLKALDIDYMRADEAGDTGEKQRIATRKQKLLDLPATIQPDLDAIDTPEALETYEPTWPA